MSLANEFRVGLTLVDATFNQDVKALVPAADIHPRYLARCLRWLEPRVLAATEESSHGTKRLSGQVFENLPIPVPPMPEQRRIADILDKADSIRRKRKEAIALTEELRRSAFLEMFGDPVTNPKGWEVTPLGKVSDVSGGLQVTHARELHPITLPYLRVANVFRDRLDLTEVKEIRATYAEAERTALRVGDVLVVEGHGNPNELGRAAVWSGALPRCTHQNHLIRVRPTPGVLEANFLSAYLNAGSGRAQMLRMGKTTSGLNTISTNNVRAVSMLLPPIELQRSFCKIVDGNAHLLGAMQASRAATDELFAGLVDRAFRGELTGSNVAGTLSRGLFAAGTK
jgi:type I restriction enzyme S subunit